MAKLKIAIDNDIAFAIFSAELTTSKCAVEFQAGWKKPRQGGGASALPAPDVYDLASDQHTEVGFDPDAEGDDE